MDTETAVPALAALAQPTRLTLYRWLVERGPEGALPGELSEKLELPGATLSFHLKTLQHAGLIESVRSGRNIRYHANFAAMRELVDFLSRDCCGGDPSKCAPQTAVSMPKLRKRAGA